MNERLIRVLKEEMNVKEIVFDPAIAGEFELDAELTPALRHEGLVRGIERAIQGLRKEQGFKVGEQARLIYATKDIDILEALKAFNKEKTYITEAVSGSPAGEPMQIEGKAFSLALERT